MVFADSSGFIAAYSARDADHSRALEAWRSIAARRQKILTTDLVFAETVTLLRRWNGHPASRQAGQAILRSANIDIAGLDREQLRLAWREFVAIGDPKLSLCDAASFVVMRERGITEAFTFDRHFRNAGFHTVP